MKQFALPESTPVHVLSFACRREKHGKDKVPAIDLRLEMTCSNLVLDQLKPSLRHALYTAPDADHKALPQGEIEEVEAISDTPLLRVEGLQPVHLADELTGYTVTIDLGTGRKESIVELTGCKLNAFSVEALQGGSVKIGWRVQAAGLKEREIGKLGVLIDCETAVRLEPPAIQEEVAP